MTSTSVAASVVGAQTGVHGRALDVQHVDAGLVGEHLHGRVRELDPHRQGHVDDLGHGGHSRFEVSRTTGGTGNAGIKSRHRTARSCSSLRGPL